MSTEREWDRAYADAYGHHQWYVDKYKFENGQEYKDPISTTLELIQGRINNCLSELRAADYAEDAYDLGYNAALKKEISFLDGLLENLRRK